MSEEEKFYWEIFSKTGSLTAYLLYREAEES